MTKLFGTDGIRGRAFEVVTEDLAYSFGAAVARLAGSGEVVVGRDTRASGGVLADAVCAGVCSVGLCAVDVGVVPTPAVAFGVSSMSASAGIVVSASHNPASDNGLKVFGSDGAKLSVTLEDAIEALIASPDSSVGVATGSRRAFDVTSAYVDWLVSQVGRDFGGLPIVVDRANGAAGIVAPEVFRRVGLDASFVDDGGEINDGFGAMWPGVVGAAAGERRCIGLTLDGDADRVLAADEAGEPIDGDQMVAIMAEHLLGQGLLSGNGIAVTSMSNYALHDWAARRGVTVATTDVGDRAVLSALRENGFILGGEQSGHILRLDCAPAGDGLLSGLLLLAALDGSRLTDAVPFEPWPQVMRNVSVADRSELASCEAIWVGVERSRHRLGESGRVLVRSSGTEQIVRVMVEARDLSLAERECADLAAIVATQLGRVNA